MACGAQPTSKVAWLLGQGGAGILPRRRPAVDRRPRRRAGADARRPRRRSLPRRRPAEAPAQHARVFVAATAAPLVGAVGASFGATSYVASRTMI